MKNELERFEKYKAEKLRPALLPSLKYIGKELLIIDENGQTQSDKICIVYPTSSNTEQEAIEKLEKAVKIKGVQGIVLNFSLLKSYENVASAAQRIIPRDKIIVSIKDASLAVNTSFKNSALLLEGEEVFIREALARNGLSKRYEKARVYLNIKSPNILELGEGWHIYAACGTNAFGARVALRRITYPKILSSGGAFPVRIWLHNTGTSAKYCNLKVKMYIKTSDALHKIALKSVLNKMPIGDATINEIAVLPRIAKGCYTLLCGVFDKNNAIKLANDEKCTDGLYEIGSINLDDVERNEYYTIWDNYYPEGYYPLEDPKLPY